MPDIEPVIYLDDPGLRRSFSGGIRRVLDQQLHLNRINVFPVPDGDTGTNLSSTLLAINSALRTRQTAHAGELLSVLADAALDGARGNSGAIFAAFLQGASGAVASQLHLHGTDIVAAMKAGAVTARNALSQPREGTMISIIDAMAAVPVGLADAGLHTLLQQMCQRGQTALQATTQQLPELRRAGVVDAGALGFQLLMEGMLNCTASDSCDDIPLQSEPEPEHCHPALAAMGPPNYRYCIECVIVGSELDSHAVRTALKTEGDSIVVSGSAQKIRVHIHADSPEAIFGTAATFGVIASRKADDLRRQVSALATGNHSTALVTDSAADLPEALLQELGIHVVPLRVHIGEISHIDKMGITTRQVFAEANQAGIHATTSQPAPADYRRVYEYLATHFARILSISLSPQLSGTYQAAQTAIARLSDPARVHLVDSRSASVGQGLIVLFAAKCIRAGLMDSALDNAVAACVARTQTWAIAPDLTFAVRGGRVHPAAKWVADRLGITPVLGGTAEGKLRVRGILIGRHDLAQRFARYVSRRMVRGLQWQFAVGHADAPEAAATLHSELLRRVPGCTLAFSTEIGAVLGAHAGSGALVIAIQHD